MRLFLILAFCALTGSLHAQRSSCSPEWIPTFGAPPGADSALFDFVKFDDGTGAAVYAAGYFKRIGSDPVEGLAKWDGANWQPVGGGVDGAVVALHVHDDGSGAALYASGYFQTAGGVSANGLAKWDGTSWSSLGAGSGAVPVKGFTTFDSGSGPLLIAGGEFSSMDGVAVTNVASFDGTQWSALGTIGLGNVEAFQVFNDGSGAALYAGGVGNGLGGFSEGIARWDGTNWSAVGGGGGALKSGMCARSPCSTTAAERSFLREAHSPFLFLIWSPLWPSGTESNGARSATVPCSSGRTSRSMMTEAVLISTSAAAAPFHPIPPIR